MKFGQLIERNMRNISLENSYTKCDGESKIEHMSGAIVQNFIKFVFIVYQVEAEAYKKAKRCLKLDPLPDFLHDF